MIIKSVPGGDTSRIVNYVCRDSTANDKNLLMGNPNLTSKIIDNSKWDQNYYHFILSQNDMKDDISMDHWKVILSTFREQFFVGFDEKEFNDLWVLHEGHIHGVVPKMNLLDGKANYYYNDSTDRYRMNLIRDLIHNIDFTQYGLSDLKLKHPNDAEEKEFSNSRLDEIIEFRKMDKRDYSGLDNLSITKKKKLFIRDIQKEVSNLCEEGFFQEPEQLLEYMKEGLEVEKFGYDNKFKSPKNPDGYYVSVKEHSIDSNKSIRVPIKEFNDGYYNDKKFTKLQTKEPGIDKIKEDLIIANEKRVAYLEKRKGKAKEFKDKTLSNLSNFNNIDFNNKLKDGLEQFDLAATTIGKRISSNEELGDLFPRKKTISKSIIPLYEENLLDEVNGKKYYSKVNEYDEFDFKDENMHKKRTNILGTSMAYEKIKKVYEDRIPELKKSINMVDYLQNYGVSKLRKSGMDKYLCCSPIRNESKPSFSIMLDNNNNWRYFDFSDNSSGSIIDLHMQLTNCSLERAIDDLTSGQYANIPKSIVHDEKIYSKDLNEINVKPTIKEQRLLKYIDERGIKKIVPGINQIDEYKTIKGQLRRYSYVGLKNNSNGFAIRNSLFKGNIGNTNISEIDNKSDKTMIVEGMFDYMTLYQKYGEQVNYISLNSITNIDKLNLDFNKEYCICLNNDEPGHKATKQINEKFKNHKLKVMFPNGKDFNEDLLKGNSMNYQAKTMQEYLKPKIKTQTKKIKKHGKTVSKQIEVDVNDIDR